MMLALDLSWPLFPTPQTHTKLFKSPITIFLSQCPDPSPMTHPQAPRHLQPLLTPGAVSPKVAGSLLPQGSHPYPDLSTSDGISQLCFCPGHCQRSPELQKVEKGPKLDLKGPDPSWDHPPEQSLLQWWSRNHRLQTRLGKLLLRDGAILSKQHPMSPAGHLLKILLDIAL